MTFTHGGRQIIRGWGRVWETEVL